MSKFSFSNLPKLSLLSKESIERIHSSSLELLERIGVSIDNDNALSILRKAGADVDAKKKHAKIPQQLVKEVLLDAPSGIKLYSRDGKHDLLLQGDKVHFDPGSAAVTILDPETNDVRKPALKDLRSFVIVTDCLRSIQAQSTALVPSDVPDAIKDRMRLYVVLKHSVKPVVTGAFTIDGVHDMKRMLEIVLGDEEVEMKPMAVFDICPSPPLKWSNVIMQNLIDCARSGLPIELVAMPQMGATGPATVAGCLIQHNAEILSGVVIAQLVNKGTPVIYGGSPALFEMRWGTSVMSAPEVSLLSCGYVDVAKYYGLPTHAYLGMSDAKVVDYQSGLESMMGIIIGALKGINMVSGPGMIEFESCQSVEKLVLDDEICGYVLRIMRGIEVNEETLGVDVFEDAIAKGHFLTQRHTLEWFKKEQYTPSKLIDRHDRSKWNALQRKDAFERAKDRVKEILREHKAEPLPKDVEKELDGFAESIAKTHGMGRMPL